MGQVRRSAFGKLCVYMWVCILWNDSSVLAFFIFLFILFFLERLHTLRQVEKTEIDFYILGEYTIVAFFFFFFRKLQRVITAEMSHPGRANNQHYNFLCLLLNTFFFSSVR